MVELKYIEGPLLAGVMILAAVIIAILGAVKAIGEIPQRVAALGVLNVLSAIKTGFVFWILIQNRQKWKYLIFQTLLFGMLGELLYVIGNFMTFQFVWTARPPYFLAGTITVIVGTGISAVATYGLLLILLKNFGKQVSSVTR